MTKNRKRFKGRSAPTTSTARRRIGGAWLYGFHAVTAALANPARDRLRLLATRQAVGEIGEDATSAEIVDQDEIESVLPRGAIHQGLALLAEPLAPVAVEMLCTTAQEVDRAVVVVLDKVSDPRNVGAVLRSAAVFGAIGVIVPERGAPDVTGALAKAASGALETVPLVQATNVSRALDLLKEAGLWCAGFDAGAETTLAAATLAPKTAIVLGAEGAGLRRLVRERCDFLVRIEALGPISSLNVSNAAAVALYEFARRR